MRRILSVVWAVFLALILTLPGATALGARPGIPPSPAPLPGGTLDPLTIPKYMSPLTALPAMPATAIFPTYDYYEVAARQFPQQVLPPGMPTTDVWGYGSVNHPGTFSYPGYTFEASYNRPVRVKWINDLVDAAGNFLSHLLPVDQTLHWANPPGGLMGRDMSGTDPNPYTGPVPMITHLHGAHVTQESDGFPEAWYLPAAANIPTGYATEGSYYQQFKSEAEALYGQTWDPGAAVFQYPNDQRATTLWYHDHSLGMTRTNVYTGLAGFYMVRGGPDDLPSTTLPSGQYEVPVLIQDRSFNADGSLFYPGDRAFFEGLTPDQLQIPFIPEQTLAGADSDVSPIWNPEFFGNTMVVNGQTWPYLNVEQKRYRMRFLNGSDSRFLILRLSNGGTFWQIGADGGFLPAPAQQSELLIGPAERADIIVDFSKAKAGATILLQNVGPDEPFGGGLPGVDFAASNPDTTGQVMQFRVVAKQGKDTSTPPAQLTLPTLYPITAPVDTTRQVSLNELDSATVFIRKGPGGSIVESRNGMPFGPMMAMLGTVNPDGTGNPLGWDAPVTENPAVGDTEIWEIHNFTADAHPIHIHLVQFEVIDRIDAAGVARGPEPWETGTKDTVISYPGEITRVKATFDMAGLFVWHCHILSHEDHEMMRPYQVGP